MKLVIVPGLSSPNCRKYRPVYGLLLEEGARRLPGCRPEVTLLPGQTDSSGEAQGEFLMPEASARLRDMLEHHSSDDVVVIARSTGCNVVANVLAGWKSSPVRKAVLWGPTPFWLYYHMFVRNTDENYAHAEDTGVRVSCGIAASGIPFESLLHETEKRILICAGTRDEYCPPAYLDYLRVIFRDKTNIEFEQVDGCAHSVTPDDTHRSQYADTIFGWLRG